MSGQDGQKDVTAWWRRPMRMMRYDWMYDIARVKDADLHVGSVLNEAKKRDRRSIKSEHVAEMRQVLDEWIAETGFPDRCIYRQSRMGLPWKECST